MTPTGRPSASSTAKPVATEKSSSLTRLVGGTERPESPAAIDVSASGRPASLFAPEHELPAGGQPFEVRCLLSPTRLDRSPPHARQAVLRVAQRDLRGVALQLRRQGGSGGVGLDCWAWSLFGRRADSAAARRACRGRAGNERSSFSLTGGVSVYRLQLARCSLNPQLFHGPDIGHPAGGGRCCWCCSPPAAGTQTKSELAPLHSPALAPPRPSRTPPLTRAQAPSPAGCPSPARAAPPAASPRTRRSRRPWRA